MWLTSSIQMDIRKTSYGLVTAVYDESLLATWCSLLIDNKLRTSHRGVTDDYRKSTCMSVLFMPSSVL